MSLKNCNQSSVLYSLGMRHMSGNDEKEFIKESILGEYGIATREYDVSWKTDPYIIECSSNDSGEQLYR